MDPSSHQPHGLLPAIVASHRQNDTASGSFQAMPEESSSLTLPRRSNRTRAPRKSKEEWGQIKIPFTKLYVDEDFSLKEAMERLNVEHGFSATYALLESLTCSIKPTRRDF